MVFYGISNFTKFRTEEAYAEGMSAKNGWNVKLRIGQGLQGPWRSLTFLELVSTGARHLSTFSFSWSVQKDEFK